MQIYQLRNTITNKSYVGKSKDVPKRMLRHRREVANKTNRRLYDSMNHHGFDAFELIILEDIPNEDRLYSNEREIFWIDKLGTLVPNGYNMTRGGDGGNTLDKWSEQEKRQLWGQQAQSRTGWKPSPKTIQNFRKAAQMREKSKTPEQKAERSRKAKERALVNNYSPPDWTKWKKGQIGTFKGKHHNVKTRQKLGKYRIGKTYEELFNAEVVEKLKEQHRQQFAGKNNPNYVEFSEEQKRQVIQVLQSRKVFMAELVDIIGVSMYILRMWFKDQNIPRYQRLYKGLTIKEWCHFWKQRYAN